MCVTSQRIVCIILLNLSKVRLPQTQTGIVGGIEITDFKITNWQEILPPIVSMFSHINYDDKKIVTNNAFSIGYAPIKVKHSL